jgi:hypothetical protein
MRGRVPNVPGAVAELEGLLKREDASATFAWNRAAGVR